MAVLSKLIHKQRTAKIPKIPENAKALFVTSIKIGVSINMEGGSINGNIRPMAATLTNQKVAPTNFGMATFFLCMKPGIMRTDIPKIRLVTNPNKYI